MSTNIKDFDWDSFWKGFSEDANEIQDVNGVIFRDESGHWKMVVVVPNSFDVFCMPVYYNPLNGKKLE